MLRRVLNNADEIQDSLSPEAWSALSRMRATFSRQKFVADPEVALCAKVTRKLSELTTQTIPQFFGLAENSMMEDDGWRFCRLGQQLERAIITANAPLACAKAFTGPADRPQRLGHHTEIELSAFLRLLGDARRIPPRYRCAPNRCPCSSCSSRTRKRRALSCTVYQIARRCCAPPIQRRPERGHKPLMAVEGFCDRLRRIDWATYFERLQPAEEDFAPPAPPVALEEIQNASRDGVNGRPPAEATPTDRTQGQALTALLNELLRGTTDLHHVIADVFLNHQAHISTPKQSYLRGFTRGV